MAYCTLERAATTLGKSKVASAILTKSCFTLSWRAASDIVSKSTTTSSRSALGKCRVELILTRICQAIHRTIGPYLMMGVVIWWY